MNKLILAVFVFILISSQVSAAEVAYILEDVSSPSSSILNILNDLSLSYDIIRDSEISSPAIFSEYSVLLVADNVNNKDKIPFEEKHAVFFHRGIAREVWGFSSGDTGETSGRYIEAFDEDSFVFEGITIPPNDEIQVYSTTSDIHFLKRAIGGMHTAAIRQNAAFDPVISYTAEDFGGAIVKDFFFGLPESENWNTNSKLMFKNSVSWLLSDLDQDEDGFPSDEDCDDTNPEIYPGADEIAYDYIDQDCNGYDLADVDEDGYCLQGYIVENFLFQCPLEQGLFGADCNDNDFETKPNSPDLSLNCVNDAPFLSEEITDVSWVEDSSAENAIDLSEYFSDYENDELTFSVHELSETEITVSFEENMVSFSSAPDWYGTAEIIFKADDGEFSTLSNTITLTVFLESDAPVIEPIEDLAIEEDSGFSEDIILNAFDADGGIDRFEITEEDLNKVDCTITGSILIVKPAPNFYGFAVCAIRVYDNEDHYDETTLNIEVTPVNDAPEILSHFPLEETIRILLGTEQLFSIHSQDIDSNILTSWFLDGDFQIHSNSDTSEFAFSSSISGDYLLEAVVSDGEYTKQKFWNILVGSLTDFTCSELDGLVCSEEQICASQLVQVKDTAECCQTICIPKFKDADSCEVLNNNLVIEISEPDPDKKIELGEKIKLEFKVWNELEEDQNVDVEVHLYNLDRDKSETQIETYGEIKAGRSRTFRPYLEIPEDLNLDDKYAIFVKVADEVCNQNYFLLNLQRPDEKAIISEFDLPESAVCGEMITSQVRVENVGSEDLDVTLSLENAKLKINEKETFEIEMFGEDDKETKEFTLEIPENIESGTYSLKATLSYGSEKQTSTMNIEIKCNEEQVAGSTRQPQILEDKILLTSHLSQQSSQKTTGPKQSYIPFALLMTLNILLAGSVMVLWMAKGKK
ncbi:MAG: hypothetical protein KJ600_05720 [Nanoarchaeota archaeon]|nr:hypothetical protein [Nanoarchaeota archaeon]MBU1104027.1 hypothetical protein [Nanoarchaeota archaeon]